ncbi:MAG TPA: serine protease, partial [Myxococcota bacterium]
ARPGRGAEPSVARIELHWRDGRGQSGSAPLGSGFFVSRQGHAITAGHSIAKGRKRLAKVESPTDVRMVAVLPDAAENAADANPLELEVTTVEEYPEIDLALLALVEDPYSSHADPRARELLEDGVARLLLEVPDHGTAVVLSGYPNNQKQPYRTIGRLVDDAFLSEIGVRNEPSPGWLERMLGHGVRLADLDTKRGHSGGPVFLADGSGVIGVCVSIMLLNGGGTGVEPLRFPLRYRSQITVLIPSAEIVKRLQARGISWQESG